MNNGNLERQDLPNSVAWVPSVAGIVDMQVQYGISQFAQSNDVTQWVDATGAWADPTTDARNWIKAIRIALVARNDKIETDDIVTKACSSLTSVAPTGLCAWAGSASSPAPTITLAADPNWQHYRYRVFETVIPIRT